MADLLALVERHLGASWLAVVQELRAKNGLDAVEARVAAGDVDGAIHGIEEAAAKFAIDTHVVYVDGGQRMATWIEGESNKVIRFDVANDRAVRWAQQNDLGLRGQITADQKDMIRQVIADGLREGRNPRDVARDLRDSIGLTDYQAQIVENYRRALESGDWSDALGRGLTDGRSDRSVAAARRADRALSGEQVDTMVERYRRNMIGMRAETIARTEGLRALHQGTEEMLRQAVANGDVAAGALVREWNHAAGGKHPRLGHKAMDGQKRELGQSFSNPDTGAYLAFPGDPSAGVSETVNCRCVISTRMQ